MLSGPLWPRGEINGEQRQEWMLLRVRALERLGVWMQSRARIPDQQMQDGQTKVVKAHIRYLDKILVLEKMCRYAHPEVESDIHAHVTHDQLWRVPVVQQA